MAGNIHDKLFKSDFIAKATLYSRTDSGLSKVCKKSYIVSKLMDENDITHKDKRNIC